jgi:hypothetical protein
MGKQKSQKGKGKKPKQPKQSDGKGDPILAAATELGLEILTLAEAAELLRVPVDGLKADAESGSVPARLIAGEWRFMKHALFNWLRYPPHQPYPLSAVGPQVELPGRIVKAIPKAEGVMMVDLPYSDETAEEQEAYRLRMRELRDEWGKVGESAG